jgi:osmotically-inducible protein OsmY
MVNDRATRQRVVSSPGNPVENQHEVAREVARTLEASGRFRSHQVEISSSAGIVRLRGRVKSYYQKQLAQAAALAVIQGQRVVNEIEVR